MKRNERYPYYGKIRVLENPEAGAIWRSRDIEPPFCDSFPITTYGEFDSEKDNDIDFGFRLWMIIFDSMSERQSNVIFKRIVLEMTFSEMAKEYGVSLERIRQVYKNAVKKVRSPEILGKLTNPKLLSVSVDP
jgi:hypothetical protein